MSTIILSDEIEEPERTVSKMEFTEDSEVSKINCGGATILSSRVDDTKLWGHASDPQTGTKVILGGRVAFEEQKWKKSRELPYKGGLAPRLILDKFLNSNKENLYESLNGMFGVIIYDPVESQVHLITDRMGMYPFYINTEGDTTISTHPDILARNLDGELELDKITVAEVVSRAESVFPYTYYKKIHQLPPSTHIEIRNNNGLNIRDKTEYWRPGYLNGELEWDKNKLIRDLSKAIKKAVRIRTHSVFENPGILLSGGIDSRGLLYAMEDPSKATVLTYIQSKDKKEYQVAHKLAKIAGADHIPLFLGDGHYVKNCHKSVYLSSGMWSLATDHLTPFIGEISDMEFDAILSGCYSDYFFKGLSDNINNIGMFGYNLPFRKLDEYSHSYYYDHYGLSEKYESEVESRWRSRFKNAISCHDDSMTRYIAEDLRMRPVSREADIATRLVPMRTLPWDHLLSDKNVLEIYGKTPIKIKKDEKFFEEVVYNILPDEAKSIEVSNTGVPLNTSRWYEIYSKIKEKLASTSDASTNDDVQVRSLRELVTFLQSEGTQVNNIWYRRSQKEKKLFKEMLEFNPWTEDFSDWPENKKHLLYRILTTHIWISDNSHKLSET